MKNVKFRAWEVFEAWILVHKSSSLMMAQGMAEPQPSETEELAFPRVGFGPPETEGGGVEPTSAQSWLCAFVLWLVSQNLDICFLFTDLGERKAVKWTLKLGGEREGEGRSEEDDLTGGEVDCAALPSCSLRKMRKM